MDTPDIQIKQMVLNRLARCAVCHHIYEADDIHVLSRKPDMWMMVVECAECRAKNFVAAVLNDGDPNEAQGELRRLTEHARSGRTLAGAPVALEDMASVGPPVGPLDVLEMHEFLQTFDGDFRAIFAKG